MSVTIIYTALDSKLRYETIEDHRGEESMSMIKRIMLDGFTVREQGCVATNTVGVAPQRIFCGANADGKRYPNTIYREEWATHGRYIPSEFTVQSPAIRYHYVAPSRILGATWEEEI